jgi:pyruvate formate lyase activating enzyme
MSGIVFDIRRYSLHDGPGIRTAVFLKGCPLRCPWCHNPEGLSPEPDLLRRPERCVSCGACVKACPAGLDPRRDAGARECLAACAAQPGRGFPCSEACPAEAIQTLGIEMDVDTLLRELRGDLPFYEESGGGATFTGGEPLSQPEFLGELLDACRAASIRTAVDTSGYAPGAVVEDIARRADLFLFDLKLADGPRHEALTGAHNASIFANLRILAAAGAPVALRLPIIPGINDLPGDLEALADFARSLGLPWAVHLLPYHGAAGGKYRLRGEEYPLAGLAPPTQESLREIAGLFFARGLAATIGG